MPADIDTQFDVYERFGAVTTLISTSATGGNGAADGGFAAASEDGTRVLFSTVEQLSAGDSDSSSGSSTSGLPETPRSISTGPAGGNGPFAVSFYALGEHPRRRVACVLRHREQMTADDTDSQFDIYERFSGSTTLSLDGAGRWQWCVQRRADAALADGNRVVFSTSEALLREDTDAVTDIYVRQGGTLERLSVGPEGGNAANGGAVFKGASQDAQAISFATHEKLTADDNRTSCRTSIRSARPSRHARTSTGGSRHHRERVRSPGR